MKILITIILFITFFSTSFAQNALLLAYPREIIGEGVTGNIAYFKGDNRPFTGILVDKNTNKKIGEFKNGYKNGIFTEYYSNGKKKFEGKYINGVKDGVHTEWFENKKKKSSSNYENGIIVDGIYVTFLENGEKDTETTYKDGQRIKEGKYKNGQYYELSTVYFTDGRTKKSEGYLKNGEKDGLWTDWYKGGQISCEGYYKSGKEDSLWTWWYPNGEKKKEVKYNNGNMLAVIFENNVDPMLSVNAKLRPNSYLFRCLSNVEDSTLNVMVNFNFERTEKNKELVINILNALQLRLRLIDVTEKYLYGKELLRYDIEFSNPQLTVALEGKLTLWSTPGYVGRTTVSMLIKDISNGKVLFDNIVEGKSDKYENQSDAYSFTPTLLGPKIIDQIYHAFKIKKTVKEILEADGDGEAEVISLQVSNYQLFPKGFVFNIYDENDLNKLLGEVEVTKTENNVTVCEVNEGGEIISSSMKSGKKLVAISKY